MIKRLFIMLVLVGLVLGGIFGWKYRQMQQMAAQMAQPQPPATVAAAEVEQRSWERYLSAVGSVTATQGTYVTNEVAGQISTIEFESGQRVTEGDVLVRLDASVDQADLEGLIAERRLAEIEFKRLGRLIQQNSASQQAYDQAQAALDKARARVASKRALIRKKTIHAPFSGRLGIRQVNLGEYLAPGSQIVLLQALDPIYVDYAVPERHYSALHEGQTVLVEIQARRGTTYEGTITAINPGVDTGTRSVKIRATLANPQGELRPGMFADVRTRLGEPKRVLTLPRTAISYNPYGDSVFAIEEQDEGLVVERRQIQTGEARNGEVEIREGLSRGQAVVKAGHQKLRNGQKVQIDNSVALDAQVAGS